MEEIKNKIRNYLARASKDSHFEDDEDIFKLGLVHSLFAVQLIIFIEKNFEIELNDEDLNLEKIRTINDIAGLVENKLRVFL